MKLIKVLAAIAVSMILLACSMNSERPIFLPSDGDYIGQKLEMEDFGKSGKFEKGFLQISPVPDGSYVLASIPPTDKENGHIILKAVQKIPDGIIYALQMTNVPKTLSDGTTSKLSYDVYPVKILSDGSVILMQFKPTDDAINSAKIYGINAGKGFAEIKINTPFKRKNVQCYIQNLIQNNQYELMSKDKPVMTRLIGYKAPKEIGISGCE